MKLVALSFERRRLSLWVATPVSRMSRAEKPSGSSRPERSAATSDATNADPKVADITA